LGAVAYICLLGRLRSEGLHFKISLGKKFMNPITNDRNLGLEVYACYLSYGRSLSRRTMVQVSMCINGDTLLQKYLKQKGLWLCLK
jgi:hypothetical protein